jgi:hypothetical protein
MPYERIILGPRYTVRLEDLRAEHAVMIECVACRRRALVAPHRLHERFAGYERMSQIAAAMRCKCCGATRAMDWSVLKALPPRP